MVTKFKCLFCGESFDLDKISRPMEKGIFDFVWVPDSCPSCHRFDRKFKNEWYVTSGMMRYDYYQKMIISRAVRYCRVDKNGQIED